MAGKQKQMKQAVSDKFLKALIGLCIVLALGDFFIHRHAYFNLEARPFFFVFMGGLSMLSVIGISLLIKRLLIRPEDYYDTRHMTDKSADKGKADND